MNDFSAIFNLRNEMLILVHFTSTYNLILKTRLLIRVDPEKK